MWHRCVTGAWDYIHAFYPRQRLLPVVFIWKIPPPPPPFNLICGWFCQDLTGLYHGEFHIFWSKLGWNYNNYCQSSFAYLECQKSNDSTKGKAKHYLLLGFFFNNTARSLAWKSWPNFFLLVIHFHPCHLKPKLRHWSGAILIKTEP